MFILLLLYIIIIIYRKFYFILFIEKGPASIVAWVQVDVKRSSFMHYCKKSKPSYVLFRKIKL